MVRRGPADALLEREDAARLAIVALGPDRALVAGVDELADDAQAAAFDPERAFDEVVGAELARDLGQPARGALERHDRGAADDGQTRRIDLAEAGDGLLGAAVGEIVLASARTEVLERQYGHEEAAVRNWSGQGGHRRDEAVAEARDGLDEGRCAALVAEDAPQLADRGVDAELGLDMDPRAPETLSDGPAGDEATGLAEEQGQEFGRQPFERQGLAVAPELERDRVELEVAPKR